MLSTLFKHEMRATAKTFLWLYIAFAAIAVVNALLMPNYAPFGAGAVIVSSGPIDADMALTAGPSLVPAIFMTLYILSIIAIGIITFIVIILRFYRNLLGDEGYLMMTLPVAREEHLLSKLFVAVIWSVCSGVLIFLSILLIIATMGGLGELAAALNEAAIVGIPVGRWASMVVLMLVVSAFSGVLMLYAAMAIGPNLLKNRLGGSILAFIIICIASQILMFGVMSAVVVMLGGYEAIGGAMMYEAAHEGMNAAPFVMQQADIAIADTLMGFCIVVPGAIAIVCWFLSRFMLKRKLNLA